MHGIRRTDIEIGAGNLTGRKKPCLWVIKGGHLSVLGQFRDNESEELFWKLIDYVAFGNHEDKARKALEAYLNG